MKKIKIALILLLAIGLGSSKTIASENTEVYADCFTECSIEANVMVGIFGGGNEWSFFWFSNCYDRDCGDDSGLFTFPIAP